MNMLSTPKLLAKFYFLTDIFFVNKEFIDKAVNDKKWSKNGKFWASSSTFP